MKRFITIILMLLLIPATLLSGCARSEQETGKENRISVICTVFPQFDWVREILGDSTDNVVLAPPLNSRIDLHNYQPSVDDIIKISTCDLFIYVGGVSDGWVSDAITSATNKNMVVISLLDALGDAAKIEEIVEGMEDDDHDHEEEAHDDEHGHEPEYDEHVWLSLKNAQALCKVIADALSSLDAVNAAAYRNNLAIYNSKLSALDSEYQAAVDSAAVKTLLFGDRFPFRYLADDYGIGYYAAFAGCSAETEASFETIVFLAEKIDELDLRNIIVTESSNRRIAETIIRESKNGNRRILVMNAMQSVAPGDVANGITYLSIMESNLNVLREALS